MRTICLFTRILAGYALAVVAVTAAIAYFEGLPSATSITNRRDERLVEIGILVLLGSAIPFVISAVIAELRGIRHWAYYTLFAGLSALGLSIAMAVATPPSIHEWTFYLRSVPYAGLGGFVYWAVSGRYAGIKARPGNTTL